MTPENVLRASELIAELGRCQVQYEVAQSADRFSIGFAHHHSEQLVAKGGEFLDEIRNVVISTLTKRIDDLQRELQALGVELPAPDFVNLPDYRETAEAEARQRQS